MQIPYQKDENVKRDSVEIRSDGGGDTAEPVNCPVCGARLPGLDNTLINSHLTINNTNMEATGAAGMTIEEMYQKKSHLEHLLRPDTYIGSIEKHTHTLWVFENDEIVQRAVPYFPGFTRSSTKFWLNAADNKQRDPSMNALKVTIDVDENCITVYNNGDGVPVEIHQEEQV
ncbi:DNA topoisomerase 2 [Orobanche gracilis]